MPKKVLVNNRSFGNEEGLYLIEESDFQRLKTLTKELTMPQKKWELPPETLALFNKMFCPRNRLRVVRHVFTFQTDVGYFSPSLGIVDRKEFISSHPFKGPLGRIAKMYTKQDVSFRGYARA